MDQNSQPLVAVVILNYNTRDLLDKFLPGVLASSYQNKEVWVADNASKDGSLDLVREKFPEVKTIQIDTNLGYAGGYNEALAQVKADFYVLLNSDVEVTDNWLEPMVDLALSDPSIAAMQPKILDYKYRDRFEYAGACGGFMDRHAYPFCRGRMFDTLEVDQGQYNDAMEIFWATGACMFIKAEAFHEVGGLDADFFAHMEEIDMCWRLRRLGYKLYICPQSEIYHMGGGTLANGSTRKYHLNYRNNLIMLIKNFPAGKWFWAMIKRMILDGISGIRFLLMGQGRILWTIIKAHFEVWSKLAYWRKRGQLNTEKPEVQVNLYPKSVVWAYFMKGKKNFSDLDPEGL